LSADLVRAVDPRPLAEAQITAGTRSFFASFCSAPTLVTML